MPDQQPDTGGTPDDQGGATPPPADTASTPPPGDEPAAPPAEQAPATDAADKGEDWKARSRTWEDRAKANKAAADKATAEAAKASETLAAVRKAFGLDGADQDDPATAAEKAAAERDAKDAELRTLKIERAAEKVGRKAGADVDLLLDSRGFATTVARLDPAADTFDDDLTAAVEKALDGNPRLKAAPAAKASATVDVAGGGQPGGEQLTRAQLKTMTPKQIEAAREAGKLRTLLGG